MALLHTRTGRRKHLLICDGDGAHSLAFSTDGKLLASGTGTGSVKLWDVASGTLARSLEGHTSWASAVAFSPDGRTLASGGHDNTVRLWKVRTGECLEKLSALEFAVLSATCSPDGKTIASGHNNSSLRVWDAATGELVRTITCQRPWVSQVKFSEAGAALTALSYPPGWSRSSGAIETWAWPGGELEQSSVLHASERRPVPSTSPDGQLLATVNQKGKIALRDARSGDLVRELDSPEAPDEIVSLIFAPDGRTLAAGHLWFSVSLWDVESGRFLWLARTHADSISSLAFSPDGSTLAVGGDYDETVVLWDLRTRRRKTTLKGHTNNIRSVTFSPDGTKVVTASADGTVRLWETTTGRLLATFMVLPPDSEEIQGVDHLHARGLLPGIPGGGALHPLGQRCGDLRRRTVRGHVPSPGKAGGSAAMKRPFVLESEACGPKLPPAAGLLLALGLVLCGAPRAVRAAGASGHGETRLDLDLPRRVRRHAARPRQVG